MNSELFLEGKTVLITGAGGGIGNCIARVFANKGARIILSDIRKDAGQNVAKELNGTFIKADLSSISDTKNLCEKAISVHGNIDILVNNAGYQHMDPVEKFPEDIWAKMIQVMLVAPFQLTKAVIPSMKTHQWGRIINLSSIHGLIASPYKSAYTAAKHGIIGLTKTVALEVGEDGITVNALCPAYARTPLVDSQIKSQARTHGISESEVMDTIILKPAAIKHLVEPEEIANLALFLASDNARSITGSAYTIDLGWTAR